MFFFFKSFQKEHPNRQYDTHEQSEKLDPHEAGPAPTEKEQQGPKERSKSSTTRPSSWLKDFYAYYNLLHAIARKWCPLKPCQLG